MLNVGSTAIGPLLVGGSLDVFGSYTLCVRGIALCTAGFAVLSLSMHPPVKPAASGSAAVAAAVGEAELHVLDEGATAVEAEAAKSREGQPVPGAPKRSGITSSLKPKAYAKLQPS